MKKREALFDIRWRWEKYPDDEYECTGLDARTLAARLRRATKNGSIVVVALTARMPTQENAA